MKFPGVVAVLCVVSSGLVLYTGDNLMLLSPLDRNVHTTNLIHQNDMSCSVLKYKKLEGKSKDEIEENGKVG